MTLSEISYPNCRTAENARLVSLPQMRLNMKQAPSFSQLDRQCLDLDGSSESWKPCATSTSLVLVAHNVLDDSAAVVVGGQE